MTVLVDTSIWSLALRRPQHKLSRPEVTLVDRWRQLVHDEQVVIIGPIRQELLSGVRQEADYLKLCECLAAFNDLPLARADYELAAHYFNQLRRMGFSGSPTDLLICAAAHRFSIDIFTSDTDFEHYAQHLPVELFSR